MDAHRSTDHWGDGLPPGAEKPRVAWKEQHSLASCSTGGERRETRILGMQRGKAEASGSSHFGVFLTDEAEQLITEGEAALLYNCSRQIPSDEGI